MQDFIKINKDDNVAVALKPIAKGTTVNVAGTEVTTVEEKGEINALMADFRTVAADQKKAIGVKINELKHIRQRFCE